LSPGCFISSFESYASPLGSAKINLEINEALEEAGFSQMDINSETEEHSIEMQIPFVHKCMENNEHAGVSSYEHPIISSYKHPIISSHKHPIISSYEYTIIPSYEYTIIASDNLCFFN